MSHVYAISPSSEVPTVVPPSSTELIVCVRVDPSLCGTDRLHGQSKGVPSHDNRDTERL